MKPDFFLSQRNAVELICLDCSKVLGSGMWRARVGEPEKGGLTSELQVAKETDKTNCAGRGANQVRVKSFKDRSGED